MDNVKKYLKTWHLFGIEAINKNLLPNIVNNTKDNDNISTKIEKNKELSIEEKWRLLENRVRNCKKCPYFAHRKNVVIGEGNRNTKVLLIGEAPWKDEDREGKPFVGKAGKLLTQILRYIKIDRKDIYIANVVKCIPPQRKAPEDNVIQICSPYLMEQIELIKPLIIVTLGRVASQFLLNTSMPISKMRGRWYRWNDIWVLPTFHPSYLLQNPSKGELVAEDMKTLYKKMKELGVV